MLFLLLLLSPLWLPLQLFLQQQQQLALVAFVKLSTSPRHRETEANLVNISDSLATNIARRFPGVSIKVAACYQENEHVSGMKTTNNTWIGHTQQEQQLQQEQRSLPLRPLYSVAI